MNARLSLLVLGLVVGSWVAGSPALAQSMAETKIGIYGTVVDDKGNPVPDVTILLTKVAGATEAAKVTTSKRGTFVYPSVEFIPEGYRIAIESDVWFVRTAKIRTRRGTRELFQDDVVTLGPSQQDQIPVVKYRAGNATIEFTLMKREGFVETRVAVPGAGQKRELTLDEQIDEAFAMKDYAGAITKLQTALAEKPADAELTWKLAQAQALNGDSITAIDTAKEVIAVDPERKGVRVFLAAWNLELGRAGAAIPYLVKEKSLDPQNPAVAKGLAAAYQQAGKPDEAEKELERWVELAPDDPEALLGLASRKAEKGDFATSEQLYAKLAAANPGEADHMFFNVGVSILKRPSLTEEDRQRAATAFAKAVEINPEYAKAHVRLADCLLGVGKMDDAKAHYRKFLELAPDDPEAAEVREVLTSLK
ncbi:MAG: tetratricopeptide repeat protein [Acidobacteria bacterium]|nr:tetratricopeptide repeat protein [Acidobacteriota bacterium]